MNDDNQDIVDEIFQRMTKTHEITDESKFLARAFGSDTEDCPSDSSCPAGPLPGYAEGDEKVVYLDDDEPRIGLADEDGNLLDIHAVTCDDGSIMIHIKVNDTEVEVPPEFWEACVILMRGALDDDD